MHIRQPFLKSAMLVQMVMCLATGCTKTGMTESQATDLIKRAGGLGDLNRDAQKMFAKYGTKEMNFIFGDDLTNYPALATLVDASSTRDVAIIGGSPSCPAQIQLSFGPHGYPRYIRIFLTTNDFSSTYYQSCSQIYSNIFLTN